MNDTNRAEFEVWFRAGLGDPFWLTRDIEAYNDQGTENMWQAWQASRANSIESQLDGCGATVIKIRYLEAKGMKPVGVVLMAEDGKRATIDMGRITWTGQNAEQTIKPFPAPGAWFPVDVLGFPMREYAAGKWEGAIWPSDQPKRGVLSEALVVVDKIAEGWDGCLYDDINIGSDIRTSARAILAAQADGTVIDYGTKNATQPMIAEAARDDVAGDAKRISLIDWSTDLIARLSVQAIDSDIENVASEALCLLESFKTYCAAIAASTKDGAN